MIKFLEKYLGKNAKMKFSKHKKEDLKVTIANNNKIMKKFNYKNFTTLEYGIKSFVEWYKKYY
jgi:UDP-glucuronate 4-epimerase